MIVLQDLFNILATGVYANTSLRDADNLLKDEHYPKVANIINLGVIELYKRFKLLENELTLHIDPTVSNYFLRPSRVAPLINISTSLYIEAAPTVDGFLNIVKVLGAYNASGEELRINYAGVSAFDTPIILEMAPDILQITNFSTAQAISVVYQSYPNKLTETSYADPSKYEFNISDIILDPLILYIAAKTFKPTGANDSTANADKSASYEQQYELACQKLSMYGLTVQDQTERDTFAANGWV